MSSSEVPYLPLLLEATNPTSLLGSLGSVRLEGLRLELLFMKSYRSAVFHSLEISNKCPSDDDIRVIVTSRSLGNK